jgi:fucose 4-O-acetylase-like acetyltransferase
MPAAAASHQHFIDWMKAVGMILIVVGHVVGSPDALFNSVSAPIYSKQLGVAFFIFVAGWGLSNHHKPRPEEAFNRLFPILFYGAACAVLMSIIKWVNLHDLAESNYLPLALGINVFLNYFPANPTTWYIGMYLHLVLLWWWLAPARISMLWLPLAVAGEVAVRAYFLDIGRPFTGYMMVSNWLTVFLLGYMLGHTLNAQGDASKTTSYPTMRGGLLLAGWVVLLVIWQKSALPVGFDNSFPTRRSTDDTTSLLLVSALVSGVYAVNTLLAFAVFRYWRTPALIRFIARNTLLIFILHMPLIYALASRLYPFFESRWQGKLAMIIVIFVVLGLLSEIVNRLVPIKNLRDLVWARVHRRPATH